ncbi:Hypothetical predicted protein [Mytilus galloprovincialis]|uniref:Uncharacterized protein n=1 Tax=Mytilus galloprovincialis TaxID=29158 RepID=A0A8B6BXN0_MYTGA|nr:Hypothetical predicted protein [Mytilus galloprovincialis]
MKRLLWQNKEDVTSTQSTDGIEVEKCNINIADGTWSPCNTDQGVVYPTQVAHVDDDLTRLIRKVFKRKSLDVEFAAAKTGVDQKHFSSITDDSRIASDKELSKYSYELVSKNQYHDQMSSVTNENDYDPVDNENINKMTSTIMKTYFQLREEEKGHMLAFCQLWDFANQEDFIATHQVFRSKYAVYVLVTDSLELSTAENQGIDFEDSARKFLNREADTKIAFLILLCF